MGALTTLTRMWLTRSFKPFEFKSEYDKVLPYENTDSLGLYIHIPFCRSICDFCPYCKVAYREDLCNRYIDHLLDEIRMVGSSYLSKMGSQKKVTSLYFGGGTPALAADRIGEIIGVASEFFDITEGVGLELHPDNVNVETLTKLKDAGVTKLSIGIQSFEEKYAKILGRKSPDHVAMRKALDEVSFETVSMDLIFALPDQTIDDLKSDIDTAFKAGANHVAIYPFIDFTFTGSKVKAMNKKQKRELLDSVTEYFYKRGCSRDSIWTFSMTGKERYSSMTRENFLGFGCSATTLLKDQFKVNTFNVESYMKRIEEKELPTSLTIRFSRRQRMVYWLFWTLYSTKMDTRDFEKFFGEPLKKKYGMEFWLGKKLGFLNEENGVYSLTLKGAFYYHYYENFYTLSYIDKMWGIMRKEAFPEHIEL